MEAEEEATCMAVSSDMLVDGIIQNKPQSPDLLITHDALSDQSMDAACNLPPSCRSVMLDRVAHSDGHFKHQQRDEPDLTHSEKLHIATELLDNKPGVFLTRFNKFLEAEDLVYFETLSDDYIIGFQLKEIRTRLNVSANQTMVKNRRYEAMKRLVEQGEYFGDELLKERDPLLYEQMVGQHLDGAEITALVNKSDLRFSTILLAHLDIIRNNELYEKQKEIEAAQMMDESGSEKSETEESEEESELESEDEDGHTRSKISAEEKRMLREDFVTTMKHRFLNGEDINFDYTNPQHTKKPPKKSRPAHSTARPPPGLHLPLELDEEDPDEVETRLAILNEELNCSFVAAADPEQPPLKKRNTREVQLEGTLVSPKVLTPEQEEELVDWFRNNPIFYDQSISDFKKRSKRDRLLEDKGAEMGVCGTFIWKWFRDLRTIYGKLKRKNIGQAAKSVTARKLWTMQRFQFLDQHLRIRSQRRNIGMAATGALDETSHIHASSSLAPLAPLDMDECIEAVNDEKEDKRSTPSSIPIPSSSASTHTPEARPALLTSSKTTGQKGKRKGRADEDDAILKICAQMVSHGNAQTEQDSLLNAPTDNRLAFCCYLASEVGELTESQWRVLQQTTTELIIMFREERQQQKGQQQHQKQQ